jgi:hypothetical protein
VWLADDTLPVVVEVDGATGQVLRRLNWDPGPDQNLARSPANEMVASEDMIWVCSPRSGGVVAIDRSDGTAVVVSLPGEIQGLWLDGSTCLALEYPAVVRYDQPASPQKLWRLDHALIEAVDLGAGVVNVVPWKGGVMALVRRPTEWPGRTPSPGALVTIDPAGVATTICQLEDLNSRLFIDEGQVWTTGVERWAEGIRPVEAETGLLGPTTDLGPSVLDVVVSDGYVWWLGHIRPPATNNWDRAMVVGRRRLPDGPVRESRVPGWLPRPIVVDAGRAWHTRWHCDQTGWDLVRVDVDAGPTALSVSVDLSDLLPTPQSPVGVDPATYSAEQCERLRDSLVRGWRDQHGARVPLIRRVAFESVELDGDFPRTRIIALFRHEERPGVRFGKSWRVFNDLGQLGWLDYVDINLMEQIEASGHGLPPLERCVPDAAGVVWF